MEELLRSVNIGQLLLILAGLCVGGIILLVVLNLVGLVAGLFGNLLELTTAVLTGDPMTGCGCLIGLVGCGAVACAVVFYLSVLSTCGTERAVRFCQLFGR